MNFKELGLNTQILKSIDEMGFSQPTIVQAKSIPRVIEGKDLIVMSKTGSGKTGAFSIPIIQNLVEEKYPQALILTPTRELAVQVEKDVKAFSKYTKINSMAIYGQHNMQGEVTKLKEGRQIIVGTPGRTLHHIENKTFKADKIKYLVLDEADRMLDMGFIDQMVKIIRRMPRDRVTLLFSATMPHEIQGMCRTYMKNPETIELESDTKTVDSIKQGYYRVEGNEKRTQLDRILSYKQPMSCMIFCNTRIEVDKVQNYLNRKGYVVEAIHGANTQNRRMRTISEFKNSEIQIMVATDVAARGLHIEDLELVINYDVPQDKDSYIHRIGRTGRAGNGGEAVSLVTSDDIFSLYEIEEHVGTIIEPLELPTNEEVKESLKNQTDYWIDKREKRKQNAEKKQVQKKHVKGQNPKSKSPKSSSEASKSNYKKRPSNPKKYDKAHTPKPPEKVLVEKKQATLINETPKDRQTPITEKDYIKKSEEGNKPKKKKSFFKRLFKK